MPGSEMRLGKDGQLGAEIDSLSQLKNDPFLLLLSDTDEQADYFGMEDNLFSLEQQADYFEQEDNMFSSLSNSSSSSSSLEQDLAFMGFNFSLCLIPEVSLTVTKL